SISLTHVRVLLITSCIDAATQPTYTPSLHDALPISGREDGREPSPSDRVHEVEARPTSTQHHALGRQDVDGVRAAAGERHPRPEDRKSTRLNSSHHITSYAVLWLKKKKSHEDYAEN